MSVRMRSTAMPKRLKWASARTKTAAVSFVRLLIACYSTSPCETSSPRALYSGSSSWNGSK